MKVKIIRGFRRKKKTVLDNASAPAPIIALFKIRLEQAEVDQQWGKVWTCVKNVHLPLTMDGRQTITIYIIWMESGASMESNHTLKGERRGRRKEGRKEEDFCLNLCSGRSSTREKGVLALVATAAAKNSGSRCNGSHHGRRLCT